VRVGMLGINHKLADLKLRESLAKICRRRFACDFYTHINHHLVLLSTCNRTEIYFFSEDLAETHSYILSVLRNDLSDNFDQKLYSYFGKDCLAHLCRVTTGLDSAIVTETEIQGQVKQAYEQAQKNAALPFEIHYLFQKALSIAKKVRAVLPSKPGLPDIEHAILETGQHIFDHSSDASILFVGASGINEKILSYFKHKNFSNMTICNRSRGNAETIASRYAIPILDWEQLHSWHDYDWVILGTKAPEYLIKSRPLPVHSKHKLIIDLAVPRNADPSLSRHKNITLLNIDQINRRLKIRRQYLSQSIDLAEAMVSKAIHHHLMLFHEKEKNRLRLYASTA